MSGDAGSAPLKVRHWSHVILHVADMEESLAFYRGLLGADLFSEDLIGGPDFETMIGVKGAKARIINLVLGGQKVELIEVQGVPSGEPAERVGRGLAGFTVRVDDIEEAYRLCQAHGYHCETEPTEIQGFRQFETSYTGAVAFLVIVLLTLAVVFALRRMELAR